MKIIWNKHTKKLSKYYERFGFELLDTVTYYSNKEYIYIMKKNYKK